MKKRFTSIFHHSRERGIALILTLGIITLVTLILIAFAVSMRVENTASKSFNDVIKARELAQAAVDQAVAQISQATTNRTQNPVVSTYVTSPGVIFTNVNGLLLGSVSLYSPSNPTPAYSAIRSTDLNTNFWITGTNTVEFLAASRPTIQVGWVYVATNGLMSPPNNSLNSPLVGRFAYWVDDEAAKININTANQRPADPTGIAYSSTNSEVDLSVLLANLSSSVPFIHGNQAPSGPGFTTIEEVKLGGATAGDFDANRFYLTTYSNDANFTNYTDDLDVFGLSRRVLSALTRSIDVENNPVTNISAYAHLSDTVGLPKVYSSSGAGATFDGKYTPNGLKQIIANIIDYGTLSDDATTDSQLSPTYCGLKAVPYINEVVNYAAIDQHNSNAFFGVSFELINPYATAKGNTYTLKGTWTVVAAGLTPSLPLPVNVAFGPIAVSQNVPGHGYYVTSTNWLYQTVNDAGVGSLVSGANIPVTVIFSDLRLYNSSVNLVDFAYGLTNQAPFTILSSGATNIFAIGDNDPRAHRSMTMFNPLTSATIPLWGSEVPDGTHGFYASHKPSAVTPTDLTDDGTETGETQVNYSNYYIAESPYQSVGELGYIHTGIPWRSLRLQPRGGGVGNHNIPDWAMLDMFTIGGSTAGRININSTVYGLSGASRLVPLRALLNNVVASPVAVAGNIYGGIYAYADLFGNQTAYDTIGEICEVAGMDNGASTDAAREYAIRRLANIITVRSSTFTVWVMAQSIKQVPVPTTPTIGLFTPGVDQITGEVRAQAVVERYEAPVGSAPKFRVRYFRYLYN